MGTNFLIGLRTDNFVVLAADTNAYMFGALKMTNDHVKDYKLGERLYMVCGGESGDVDAFATWAKANMDLYARRNGYEMRPKAAHHWLRKCMAENLRSEDFWRVNCIIGGYDTFTKKAELYMIDFYATNMPSQNFIFSGFPGRFGYSIMDAGYKPDLTEEEGLKLVQQCIDEVRKRAIIDLTAFRATVINADGSRTLEGLKPANLV